MGWHLGGPTFLLTNSGRGCQVKAVFDLGAETPLQGAMVRTRNHLFILSFVFSDGIFLWLPRFVVISAVVPISSPRHIL